MISSSDEWQDWLRLLRTPGVGNETARKLLATIGFPAQIFNTDFTLLRKVVSERVARQLCATVSDEITADIARTADWLAQENNQLICLGDSAYPTSLLNIPDPPILLYVKGRIELLCAPALAVVGSRNATEQGLRHAEQFSEAMSQSGLSISSGLAAGIDAAAHAGALRGAGSTIAVIGTGIDIVYPARHRALAHQIAEQGCLISEYALGTPAIAANFPRRNRIISGLALGVLVVEAAAQSGSLITARMAAEQGREVFAIPGSIHAPLAKGCHQLIKQGAKLVESAQDILEELQLPTGKMSVGTAEHGVPAALAGEHSDHLMQILGHDPMHIDVLAERSGVAVADLSVRLLEYELNGMLENLPGGLVRRLT